jgi:hypothetical protein
LLKNTKLLVLLVRAFLLLLRPWSSTTNAVFIGGKRLGHPLSGVHLRENAPAAGDGTYDEEGFGA